MLSAIDRVNRVLEISFKKINEILSEMKNEPVAKDMSISTEVVAESEPKEVESVESAEATTDLGLPPEPKETKIRSATGGKNGKLSKTALARDFFNKNPEARNKDAIAYAKEKHNVDLHPSLVSYVRNSMKLPKKSKTKAVKVKPAKVKPAKAKTQKVKSQPKSGMSMTACVTKVMARSKKGMSADEVFDKVKNLYDYKGNKGEEGFKSIVSQALHALSIEKSRRGWESSVPVLIHGDEKHTWKLNPKAKKKIA